MDTFHRSIEAARRRLIVQRFLEILGPVMAAALLFAAAASVFERLGFLSFDIGWMVAISLGLAVLAAGGWAWWTRPQLLDAAYLIDRRFALDDRLASAISLSEDQRRQPAGSALLRDTEQRLQRVDISSRFPVRLSRRLLWPLPAAGALLLVLLFVSPVGGRSRSAQPPSTATTNTIEPVREVRKQLIAPPSTDEDLEILKQKLLEAREKLAELATENRKEALVELNELRKELAEQRERLADPNRLEQQLKQLANIDRGPADKLADALRRGNPEQINRELENLRRQLEENALDPQAQQALANQLEQIEKSLEEIARKQQEAQRRLAQQLAQAEAAGNRELAEQLRKQLDQMAKNADQAEALQKLAEQLKQASQCAKAGDCRNAGAALAEAQKQLEQLARQAGRGKLLDQALADLKQLQNQMNCKQCNGRGCAACCGVGNGNGTGSGLGEGRGHGPRPIAEDDVKFRDSQAPAKVGPGGLVVSGTAGGPNLRTGAVSAIRGEIERLREEPIDPLATQPVPAPYREHTREYFDGIRESN